MDKGIRLRQLVYFVESVRAGSFLKAANLLHVSQPAITSAVRELEATLGIQLLIKGRKGVSLTDAGRLFISHATNILSEINIAADRLNAMKAANYGHIRVGVLPVIGPGLMVRAATRFKRRHPEVLLSLFPANNEVHLPSLKMGELDFVVGGMGSPEQLSGLSFTPLYQERLCLVVRGGHPLANQCPVSLKNLNSKSWLFPHPYRDIHQRLVNLFKSLAIPLPSDIFEGYYDMGAEYLAASDAVAILPFGLIQADIENGVLVEVPTQEVLPSYPVGITRRDDESPSSSALALLQEVSRIASAVRRSRADEGALV